MMRAEYLARLADFDARQAVRSLAADESHEAEHEVVLAGLDASCEPSTEEHEAALEEMEMDALIAPKPVLARSGVVAAPARRG